MLLNVNKTFNINGPIVPIVLPHRGRT